VIWSDKKLYNDGVFIEASITGCSLLLPKFGTKPARFFERGEMPRLYGPGLRLTRPAASPFGDTLKGSLQAGWRATAGYTFDDDSVSIFYRF
jgi:hypothetical protein